MLLCCAVRTSFIYRFQSQNLSLLFTLSLIQVGFESWKKRRKKKILLFQPCSIIVAQDVQEVVCAVVLTVVIALRLRSSFYHSRSYLSANDLIGEWLGDHQETTLVFFRSWSRYFSSMYFHVFFDKLSNKLLWLFCLFLSFFSRWNCISSILRNELTRLALGAVLSFAKKKSQLASNFKLTHTPTIYGEHGIIYT